MHQTYDFQTFKREINLADFSTTFGYRLDPKRSTKTSIAMKSSRDKIIVSKRGGVWVYFSVTNDEDSGTIIDFLGNRTRQSIPEIGEQLSKWSGFGVNPKNHNLKAEEPKYDQARVKSIFAKCKPLVTNQYIESRGLTPQLLASDRFAGRIFTDRHGNVAFPHFRNREACGLELKNNERGFLVKGSQKTFWRSNAKRSDKVVVVAESVIDALSYQQIRCLDDAVYLATGGGVSSRQCTFLREMLASTRNIQSVIIACDNDAGGQRIVDRLTAAIKQTSLVDAIVKHSPDKKNDDWNDVLMRRV